MENISAIQQDFQLYCNSLTAYQRLKTLEVKIGDVPMGANHPIRVQSMTTTDTMDTMATVEQSVRMIEAGCEYVRITAPSINEAKNLANIKKELRARGLRTPLVADIHFTPNAAETAARIVEKVRVNPGNYADKKKFENIDYTEATYKEEVERIRQRFTPLVKICKEYGTAMRIGTNHGSLSDRIMSRYGDTPLGMVESALEFLRICIDENFLNIVLSMKASNPQIMVQAYRLLIAKMREEFLSEISKRKIEALFPLHLGVTEAGEGEDGRIKSAMGIGALLEDGIGDTIRVSLTEDPEFEIPVARALVDRYNLRPQHAPITPLNYSTLGYTPFEYNRRDTHAVRNIGGHQVPVVILDLSGYQKITQASLFSAGYAYSVPNRKWTINDQAADFVYSGYMDTDFELPGTLALIMDYAAWKKCSDKTRRFPLFSWNEFQESSVRSEELNFIKVNLKDILRHKEELATQKNLVLIADTSNIHAMPELRRLFIELLHANIHHPVIISRDYPTEDIDFFRLYSATDGGALMLDGMGDGLMLTAQMANTSDVNKTSFGILQAARMRISKTEYISCPSCGRTLFNLQETTARIRERTSHLKGVKIGVMGCIVNGPGEMADADYGYVGAGAGKITLYKGKNVVQRNVDAVDAVDALIQLIKDNGDWVDPSPAHEHSDSLT
ncbi:MAG: (E)-4-hydroxy-3-methylbut-2-enyl-diphosphate synthase [Bacteroidetes bacterium]|jgi:(E)-4-hydroxy-3-methylbut-2-enyl-diphosphate synthase|nr:(E)-4-hydroxy-3-methylbut-2-enyl-diphosphate synthase [Bacteroidota bacterium]